MFHGFQKQPGLPTIQGALEGALVALTGREIRVFGAGRTDTGAHAVGQAAAFDMPGEVDAARTLVSLNALLPEGVAATTMRPVADGFDPRRDALWREYRYFILNRAAPSALLDEFTYHYSRELDVEKMNEACGAFVGRHDFSAFRAKSPDESSVRDVLACDTVEIFEGLVSIRVRADSFLYRMVRIMAGAAVSVGSGKINLEELSACIENPAAKPCADPLPARGLFLWQVAYRKDAGGQGDNLIM